MSQSSAETGQFNVQYRQAYSSPSDSHNLAYHGEQTCPSSANRYGIHPPQPYTSIATYSPYGNLSNESRLRSQVSLPPAGPPQFQYSHQDQDIPYLPPQSSSTALVQRTPQSHRFPGSYIASSSAVADGEACQPFHAVAQRIPPGEHHQLVGSTRHIPIVQAAGLQMEVMLNEMMTDMQQFGGNMQQKFANVYQNYTDALVALHHAGQEKHQVVSELNELKNNLGEMRNESDYWKKKWEDSENQRMDTERQLAEALDFFAQARADCEAQKAEKRTWEARFAAVLKYTKMLCDSRKCYDSQTSTVEVEADSNTTKPAENETESSCLTTVDSDGHITGDPSFCSPTVDSVEDSFDTCSPDLTSQATRSATSQNTTVCVEDGLNIVQTTTEQGMTPVCDGEHDPSDGQSDIECNMELQYPSGECEDLETLGSHESSICARPDEPSERMTTPTAVDTHVKIEDPNPYSEYSLAEEKHGQRLGFEHIDLLCHQSTKEYVCRLCIIQFPDKPPMTFPLHSSHLHLINHCEAEHPWQCDYIASLNQEQLVEAQNRVNSVSL